MTPNPGILRKFELLVLRPLFIAFLGSGIVLALWSHWWLAAGCVLAVAYLGTIGSKLHPLQSAFADLGGAQCGYCTPGILMTAKALLDREPNPSRERIKEAISGNLCRCTGYQQIYESIEEAARTMQESKR